jgi:hypothetical protein
MRLAVIIAVIAMLLFVRIPGDERWVWVLGNTAHAPALAVVTIALIQTIRTLQPVGLGILREYAAAIVIALLIGSLVELAQLGTGRNASLVDLGRNALGSLAAAGFMAVCDPRLRAFPSHRSIRRAGLIIGILCTLIVVTPVLIAGAAYYQRARNFPVLVDFGSPLSTYFVGTYDAVVVERARLPVTIRQQDPDAVGLCASLVRHGAWSLVLWEPYPDWRGYDHLAVELANTSSIPLIMRIRIRDRDLRTNRKAGYVGSIEVAPGTRTIHRIPLRDIVATDDAPGLDSAMIRSISLSGHAGNRAQDFYLTRIWLH